MFVPSVHFVLLSPTVSEKELNASNGNVEVKGKYAVLQGIFFSRRARTSPAGLNFPPPDVERVKNDEEGASQEEEVGKFVFRFCFF